MNTRDVLNIVRRATGPLKSKVNTMITRIVVDAALDSSGFQTLNVQALAGEDLDKIEHLQQGGVTHVSLPGAEGVLLGVSGSRAVVIALGVANRSARPKGLVPGETALYMALPAPFGGIKVHLHADGNISLIPFSAVTVEGDLDAEGEVKADSAGAGVTLSGHLTPSPFGPLGPPTPGT